jgi:lysophospholipase L1-like esterase
MREDAFPPGALSPTQKEERKTMPSSIRLVLLLGTLTAFAPSAYCQTEPAAPSKSVTAPSLASVQELVAAIRLMNEQDPAIAAPRIANVNGTIHPPFLKAHESFLARIKEGPVGVLFLGDSITAGWHTRGADVWKERFQNEKYQPANFGISGDRTQFVLWRIANGELDGIHPKALVLMIGTNNGEKPAEDIARGVTAIVSAIRAKLPDTKILLFGIFPRGEKADDPIRPKLKAVNAILAKLDDAHHVFYLDIGNKFLQPDGSISQSIFVDFTHPSAEGYKIWADAMQPKLDELLK